MFVSSDGDADAYKKNMAWNRSPTRGWWLPRWRRCSPQNPKSIEDYRAGKEKAFGFLVGQVMRGAQGQASPQVVNQIIRERLEQVK